MATPAYIVCYVKNTFSGLGYRTAAPVGLPAVLAPTVPMAIQAPNPPCRSLARATEPLGSFPLSPCRNNQSGRLQRSQVSAATASRRRHGAETGAERTLTLSKSARRPTQRAMALYIFFIVAVFFFCLYFFESAIVGLSSAVGTDGRRKLNCRYK